MNDYSENKTGISLEVMGDLAPLGVFGQLIRYLNNTERRVGYGIKTKEGIIALTYFQVDKIMSELLKFKKIKG